MCVPEKKAQRFSSGPRPFRARFVLARRMTDREREREREIFCFSPKEWGHFFVLPRRFLLLPVRAARVCVRVYVCMPNDVHAIASRVTWRQKKGKKTGTTGSHRTRAFEVTHAQDITLPSVFFSHQSLSRPKMMKEKKKESISFSLVRFAGRMRTARKRLTTRGHSRTAPPFFKKKKGRK